MSAAAAPSPEALGLPVIATVGEYTAYPIEYCTEDQIAELFVKVCQRGNPVLKGRPEADLVLLGRAMFRKANKLRVGQVVIHSGEPVALAFSWDAAEGGVWKDSGLDMPESLAVHAACGKAVFDVLANKVRGKTWFIGFSGVLPPHKPFLFGYLAVSSFMMGKALGYPDAFQYTLLPNLQSRTGSVFEEFGSEAENTQWHLTMAEVAVDAGAAAAELQALGDGVVTCSLTNLEFALGEGSEWMTRAAATVRLKSGDEIRGPSQEMATSHVEWLRQLQ